MTIITTIAQLMGIIPWGALFAVNTKAGLIGLGVQLAGFSLLILLRVSGNWSTIY